MCWYLIVPKSCTMKDYIRNTVSNTVVPNYLLSTALWKFQPTPCVWRVISNNIISMWQATQLQAYAKLLLEMPNKSQFRIHLSIHNALSSTTSSRWTQLIFTLTYNTVPLLVPSQLQHISLEISSTVLTLSFDG